ncbi:MAG: pyrimidine 5'-nucleotidase [Chloroflexota bacterium]
MSRLHTVLFDLDDTLYPSSSGVWQAIGERINEYMHLRVGIEPERVPILREQYFRTFGTTLNGLVAIHHIDPEDYLEYVHDLPLEDSLQPDPDLQAMLESLPQRRVVFTNASRGHAERVLNRLGVHQAIDAIVDILTLNLCNKPRPEAYRRALEIVGEPDPQACVAVDDLLANLQTAKRLGMITVLVGNRHRDESVDHRIARAADLTRAVPDLLQPPLLDSRSHD